VCVCACVYAIKQFKVLGLQSWLMNIDDKLAFKIEGHNVKVQFDYINILG
jgi:hypothetical protein